MARSGYHHRDVVPARKQLRLSQGAAIFLVTVAFAVFIALAASPNIQANENPAQLETAKTNLRELATALTTYKRDMGRYPSSAEGLENLVKAPSNEIQWRGPYLKQPHFSDPWRRPYEYESSEGGFVLMSYGGDGADGGAGTAADIIVHEGTKF